MQKFPRATYPFKYHPTIAKCFLYTLSVPNTFACFPYCPVLESVKALWSLRYKLPKKKKETEASQRKEVVGALRVTHMVLCFLKRGLFVLKFCH